MKSRAASMTVSTQFTMANLIYSEPYCVQQYIPLNQTRFIDCNVGDNATYMTELTASGIVPTNATYNALNNCFNLETYADDVSPF
jgi:hypothetical protein